MEFINALRKEMLSDYNISVTENGAVGYRTSGKELLDLNFAVTSLRSASEREIAERFYNAFLEDKVLAMKWLFFARDVREGLGERRLFREAVKYLAENNPEYIEPVIHLIPEYGRYDDLLCLLDFEAFVSPVCDFISKQMDEDMSNYYAQKPVSLLAKWLPSENASSAATKKYAKIIRKYLGLSSKNYRQALSLLRGYLDVVEIKMSSGKWDQINYEAVPSRANLIYNGAFLRNDEERRREYLGKLERGEAKINASVLYPHDIVHRYSNDVWGYSTSNSIKPADTTLEELWKALPDMVKGCGNTIVVADGSGSMCARVDGKPGGVAALEVANALAIYFAEHSSGQFKDKYITFSTSPELVDFSSADTLRDKLIIARSHNECADTNIEGVFELILDTAKKYSMSQSDLPENILIISDMEFNTCATDDCGLSLGLNNASDKMLFRSIAEDYKAAGYKLPRLVFWNVCSRTETIPVTENELGVALVSGFSVNVCKMVMSGKLDPMDCLLETINSDRYQPVEDALRTV